MKFQQITQNVADKIIYLSVTFGISLLFSGCQRLDESWSRVSTEIGGGWRVTGTIGLALMITPEGDISFTLGPEGSQWGPESTDLKSELNLLAMTPVGIWYVKKGETTIALTPDTFGHVKVHKLRIDSAPHLWALLSSPGCATLEASLKSALSSNVVVQRTYQICGVDKAVLRLRSPTS